MCFSKEKFTYLGFTLTYCAILFILKNFRNLVKIFHKKLKFTEIYELVTDELNCLR